MRIFVRMILFCHQFDKFPSIEVWAVILNPLIRFQISMVNQILVFYSAISPYQGVGFTGQRQ